MHHQPLPTRMTRASLTLAVRLALFGLVAGTGLPVTALVYAAQTSAVQERDFAIAPGLLEQALAQFASTADISVSFEPALTRNRQSPGVSGLHDVDQALQRLLAGSGVQAVRLPGGGYALTASVDVQGAVELGATSIQSQGLGDVTEQSGSYTTGTVSIGKGRQSIKDMPQTVSVISRQRLEDQKLTTLGDALAQTTGISRYEGSMVASRYLSRGFEITNFRVDGGPSVADTQWKNLDTAIYDHIEVLRGADGLFAGQGEPGGTVNLVRKRPTAQAQASITTSASRWDAYRTELDASGPLAFDGKLRGRAVVVIENKDSFIDYANSSRDLFYGVLEGDLGDSTTLFGGYTHDRTHSSDQAYGLPRYSTGEDLKLSRSTYLAGAHDYSDRTEDTWFMNLTQQLGERWTLDINGVYTKLHSTRDYYNFAGAIDPQTGSGSFAEWGGQDGYTHEKAVDIAFKGSFELLGLQHDLITGWSWHDYVTSSPLYGATSVVIDDIFNFKPRDYSSQKASQYLQANTWLHKHTDGGYVSLRMQLAEPLHWIVGGSLTNYRYDWEYASADGSTSPTRYSDRRVFVPYTGLSYDLTPEWTAYGSISEIYKSQANRLTGPLPGSGSLDPVTGRNHEIGLKGSLFNGRLNTYVALYYIKRENEAVRDRTYGSYTDASGASCCYVGDGEAISKGIDFEVSGEVLDRLQATLGYTYNHIDKSQTSLDYTSLTPKHLAKLFATYQMSGDWSRLKVGGGVTAQSATYVTGSAAVRDASGRLTDTYQDFDFSQAGYTLWSAFADYQIDSRWSVGVNLENLFDKTYYSTVGYSDYANFYGEPRRYTVTLRGKF